MDFVNGLGRGVTIEKFTESNFQVRKQKINLVVTYRKVDLFHSDKKTFAFRSS